ncbi:DUF2721 domain-containing protein [Deinococcus metallilatus]|uniref:DUF2721 domain-containing protein n=1 Tax=Deinococcus metallilatus TaxID=1211322 RepID=A0AAJ5F5P5_9DEIO|nr:DUF2721 domain-containing protein [Deinococcus metallilatus]MBB5295026.1 hypothetical protein [Deinococcus metallilatus]QBY09283.1 DUF2721 domain-containing protein [Deinococcus metallilatus]RXJ09288.1 DUF2721 domain-containing protein [Deinococcus metallilatus]TLK28810.1 DUF2721 domain-containing protein [Deinococcus metallilatus]GMA16959.1 hypothetical protein GCM10025871_32900 [Deinococcus metallilatus]
MADPNLSVLTAMITPAVLISGAGTLIMSTSTRLGRATDRVRHLTARFKVLVSAEGRQEALAREEKRMIIRQLPRLTRRTRILQRAMTSLYLAVALLVLTSILIGGASLLGNPPGPPPVVLALLGAAALAYAALLLSFETRLSARTTQEEMGFLVDLGQHYAELYGDHEPSGKLRHES